MVSFWQIQWNFPEEDSISEDILEFIQDENGRWVDSWKNAPTYNDKVYEMFWDVGHQWYQIMNRNRKPPHNQESWIIINTKV